MPERILIVADDLTGACDSAAAFAETGRAVRVFLDAAEADATAGDVIAVATESRDLAPDQAATRVAEVIDRLLPSDGRGLLFKKIDSAARGPITAEIEAALGASRATLALVTPAFPAARRTVANGVLSVRDWSGQDVQIGLRELFNPGDASHLAVLRVLPEAGLYDGIARAIEGGVRTLLCDAIEQAHLDRLAAAALRIPERILWAGSAGLARALAGQLQAGNSRPHRVVPVSRRVGRAVLFTGSPHPVTVLQIANLEDAARSNLSRSRTVHHVPEANAAPEAVVAAFTSATPAGLILTGGDTAAFVLRALGAHAIRLAGEVAPGIPWGIVEGGLADGCTVVTKSGGFGERDAFARAFEFCESEV